LLSSSPAAELEKLYRQEHVIGKTTFQDISEVLAEYPFPETPFFLRLRFDNSNRYAIWGPHAYGVKLRTKSGNTLTIGYNREMKYFYIDRSGLSGIPFSQEFERTMGAGYAITDSVSDWNILVGRHSVELFACGNKVAMTSLYYTGEKFSSAELFSDSGTTTLTEAAVGGLTGAEKRP
jgi:fructan beta-fructosidase